MINRGRPLQFEALLVVEQQVKGLEVKELISLEVRRKEASVLKILRWILQRMSDDVGWLKMLHMGLDWTGFLGHILSLLGKICIYGFSSASRSLTFSCSEQFNGLGEGSPYVSAPLGLETLSIVWPLLA